MIIVKVILALVAFLLLLVVVLSPFLLLAYIFGWIVRELYRPWL